MIKYRPVILVIGILTAALGGSMLIPLLADFFSSDPVNRENWRSFAISASICSFVGLSTAAAGWGKIDRISIRQGFLITAFSWLALVFFASLPFVFSIQGLSFTDSFFEAMSGLTTTGSTVLTGLDTAPNGLLLWRSMLQWIGGIGIVIMAIAVLPMLSIGGMQLFRMESSDTSDKVLPGASQIATAITSLYVGFTVICFFLYWLMGMTPFDAINHAMTTIATGGFSTKDASFGHFLTDPDIIGPVDLVALVFMVLGSLPFVLYLLALRGQWDKLFTDSQSSFFLSVAVIFITVMMIKIFSQFQYDLFTAFRLSSFNVISIMTGTGYATTDYWLWGPFAHSLFFCVMFVGGCAGSTSCGLKVFRLQVALAALTLYGRRIVFPHGVFVARYNGRPLTDEVFSSVLSFMFVYFACFATIAVLLSFHDLDVITILSAAGTAIANVGPGLGETIGPSGNFQTLPDGAKWTLSGAMLLGRLELFTILVLFAPSFWRD